MTIKWIVIFLGLAALAMVCLGVWWWAKRRRSDEITMSPSASLWDPTLPNFIAQRGRPLKDTPPTEEELQALESLIEAKLPSDYRAFLLKASGFDFAESMWMEFADADERTIEDWDRYADVDQLWYFSIDPHEFSGLLGGQSSYDFNKFLGNDYLAIGDGWCASIICVCIRGENYGKVFYRSGAPDEYDTPESVRASLRYVAPSFREMWNALQPGKKLGFD